MSLIAVTIIIVIGTTLWTQVTKELRIPEKQSTSDSNAFDSSEWVTYVNNPDQIPQELKEHFVNFSFGYPGDTYKVTPDESNFIKVEKSLPDTGSGRFTLESFAVGYITGETQSSPENDRDELFPALLDQLGEQFSQGFPNYKEIARMPESVDQVRGSALLFQSELKETPKGDVTIHGKVILARNPGAERGVAIIMLATSLNPDVSSPGELGAVGDTAKILRSFKLEPQ